MDIDAQNAQMQELNDAKIQEIKAQRKLFGGIIKKGDPLYKNIINVILFALLLPCMIIFGLVVGLKKLLISFLEFLICTRHFVIHAYKRTKQFFIVNYYFVKNWIINKGGLLIIKIIDGLAKGLGYFAQKLQQIYNFIKYYCLLFINNFIVVLYKWIAKKFVILMEIFKFYYIRLSNSAKIRILQFTRFAIVQIKFVIFKIKQITLKVYKVMKWLTIYIKDKITRLITYCWFQIKKVSILFHERILIPLILKITIYSIYLFIQTCRGMTKLQNAISYYGPLILDYLKTKALQFKACLYFSVTQLKKFMKYLKNKLIHYSLLIIDYLLGKYKQLNENVLSPVYFKIKEIQKKIKNLMIDLALKLIDIIKFTLVFLKNEVILKLKQKIVYYYKRGSDVSYIIFMILQKKGYRLSLKLQQIYIKIKERAAERQKKFRLILQHMQQRIKILSIIIYHYIKKICIKICNFTKYCKQKIKHFVKCIQNCIKQSIKSLKNSFKWLFKLIKKLIRWIIELQCRIIVKFIAVFKVLNPIFWLIDNILDLVFFIFSQPVLLFNNMIEKGIDIFIYQVPDKLYNGIVYLLDKLKIFLERLVQFVELVIKQAKKIMSIINQKLIYPVKKVVVSFYQSIKKVVLFIIQQLINFKDMIKYNYILPAWASIRLFGVKIKNSFIKIKNKVTQIIIYGVNQLKLAYLFLKQQILIIMQCIVNFINLFVQQIKLVYQILIGPLIQFKNKIISIILFLKKEIQRLIVAQYLIIKEAILVTLNYLKEFLIVIKLAVFEQLKAIQIILKNTYDQCKQSLIQVKNIIIEQMIYMKSILIQQKEAILKQLDSIRMSIQMQGIFIKDRMITIMNELKQMIVSIFQRN
ncbi:unnamed protein product [Paramecium sonneborni]|uniref:Transmembrane protein n=1 Tax=Paramecium sonneborni TaxID=65129 RepID=A0A8S1RCG8_9CILI|nr:unnamed protein product [Paramecium sonneborni]